MKIIMVAVVSANGKSTLGSNPNIYEWTSKEDQDFYFAFLNKSKLIVMGSSTYKAAKHLIKLKKGTLRIVLTRTPEKYENEQKSGMLEFSSETPSELVSRLKKKYNELTLVGGSDVFSSFAKEDLIDKIYLTVEPVVFGQGKDLFLEGDFAMKLKLESIEKLNEKGTLLLKYSVKK